ncbi:phytoene desaturase family protein [Metabacillus iocasae]|uniref:4,4'-diaponeurosporene oxygenase n=1 Tax=Priestia iocasae TaxID=2291674 RepID=A0ABS2QYN8_9BACI|nr:phytoene desaturase family protein [Metabacillus iocasae]MBM7703816.1 phytoene desaturase [Metabacillus iocasae]
MKKVVIVGAGLGGLATGITLVKAGFHVTIFEKNDHVGGKMMPVQLDDYQFDFGPNTITMPTVFERVFEEAGERLEDYLELIKLEHHTNNHFMDGSFFAMTTNHDDMVKQFQQLDPHAQVSYSDYLEDVKFLYETAEKHFFYRTFSSWTDYTNLSLLKALLQVRPFETMDQFHRRYFENENIRHAFNRYATYIGSSPYVSPATFALIGHLEMTDGVYYVKGGNTNIAKAFAQVFEKLGGSLHTNCEVETLIVKDKRINGVELKGKEKVDADIVVVNGDLLKAYPMLVKEEDRPRFSNQKIQSYEPSISAYVIMAGTKERHENLIHHQVYFSGNYEQEFHELFVKKQLPSDPTIYICNSSYTDRDISPGDNLFILVNAPAVTPGQQIDEEGYKEVIYTKLKSFGIDVSSKLAVEKVVTPSEIERKFGSYRGALYGISSNRKIDSFLRPSNVAKDVDHLYFVGGTTHPGGGSPMVTISGLNVGHLLIDRYR